ncbi:MAG: toxin-antitoxin system HicB family antitoxin [Verrucomicrobia bacterium]|nr:toxin-antitoxin system HicB family antitoxin [Verrucomicrobiota bacterium]
MSTLSLRLPDSLHRNLKQAAEADGISINHFVSLAVAEKLSAMQTLDIISERAKGASHSAFVRAMSLVPRGEIVAGDEPRPKRRRIGAP